MPTLKRYIDLRPIGSGEQKLPGRLQHAADSSGNRRFIICKLQKIKRRLPGTPTALFPIFDRTQYFMFLFFLA